MALGDRLTSAILHLVARIRKGVLRTQLMKLLYMADYYSYALSGRTITGVQYKFDRAGPLSIAVYGALDEMVGHEIDMEAGISALGRTYYIYRPGPSARFEPQFSQWENDVLEKILRAFGAEPWESLLEVVYETPPVQEATPGETIRMKTLRERARERIEFADRMLTAKTEPIPDTDYTLRLLKEAEDVFRRQAEAVPD
jgi:hypothetical protein